MNPLVILSGGKDALLARETFVTDIYVYVYIHTSEYVMDHNIQYKTYSLHALCTHNLVFKSATEFKFIVS